MYCEAKYCRQIIHVDCQRLSQLSSFLKVILFHALYLPYAQCTVIGSWSTQTVKCRPFNIAFFQVPMTVCTLYTVYNFNSCPGRLCEEIGQNVRKDDSCKSTLAIYMNYLSTQEERKIFHIATILCLFFGLSPFSYTYVCIGSVVS